MLSELYRCVISVSRYSSKVSRKGMGRMSYPKPLLLLRTPCFRGAPGHSSVVRVRRQGVRGKPSSDCAAADVNCESLVGSIGGESQSGTDATGGGFVSSLANCSFVTFRYRDVRRRLEEKVLFIWLTASSTSLSLLDSVRGVQRINWNIVTERLFFLAGDQQG